MEDEVSIIVWVMVVVVVVVAFLLQVEGHSEDSCFGQSMDGLQGHDEMKGRRKRYLQWTTNLMRWMEEEAGSFSQWQRVL